MGGLGTWRSPPGEVTKAVQHALTSGYRHIDCAAAYGNEKEVAAGMKASGVAREEMFITSKLWNNKHHPYLGQAKLLDFCRARGITITAYSPLGSPDRPWAKPGDISLLEDPKLKDIASKYSKSPAQVVLRWQVQRGVIVIPKSVTPSRIEENGQIFDFSLTKEEMEQINNFECNGRLIVPIVNGKPRDGAHVHYPFHIEF